MWGVLSIIVLGLPSAGDVGAQKVCYLESNFQLLLRELAVLEHRLSDVVHVELLLT
jgi:hypothetical protein